MTRPRCGPHSSFTGPPKILGDRSPCSWRSQMTATSGRAGFDSKAIIKESFLNRNRDVLLGEAMRAFNSNLVKVVKRTKLQYGLQVDKVTKTTIKFMQQVLLGYMTARLAAKTRWARSISPFWRFVASTTQLFLLA
jgi:hypothetical protein